MSCKCSVKYLSASSRAAMCQTCPSAKHNAKGSAVTCTISGKSVAEIAFDTAYQCPINRMNIDSSTRWLGVDWIGVPEPLRWVLTWQLGRSPRGLEGCGCVKAVKESWAGKYLEPWLEGISSLRARFAAALEESHGIRHTAEDFAAEGL